jgi:hypothetical protein
MVPRLTSLTKASDCVVATIFSIVGIDRSSVTTSHSTTRRAPAITEQNDGSE